MANYNYVHIHDIVRAIAKLERYNSVTIETSHGDRITYTKFGDEYVTVDRKGFHGCCDNLSDVIMCSFVRDNMRLKVVGDGKTSWYRYYDLIYVNNSRSPYYKGLYDKETCYEVCGKVGFWWNTQNVPDGVEFGVHAL